MTDATTQRKVHMNNITARPGLRPAERLTLLAIVEASDEEGLASPGRLGLAALTGMHHDTGAIALRSLVRRGLLTCVTSGGGHGVRAVYRLSDVVLAERDRA